MLTIKRVDSRLKSQLKCYACRKQFQMKDGKWVDRDRQQVFLCLACLKISPQAHG